MRLRITQSIMRGYTRKAHLLCFYCQGYHRGHSLEMLAQIVCPLKKIYRCQVVVGDKPLIPALGQRQADL